MSRRATGGPRWMAISASLRRRGTELGLQAALADNLTLGALPDLRRCYAARLMVRVRSDGEC